MNTNSPVQDFGNTVSSTYTGLQAREFMTNGKCNKHFLLAALSVGSAVFVANTNVPDYVPFAATAGIAVAVAVSADVRRHKVRGSVSRAWSLIRLPWAPILPDYAKISKQCALMSNRELYDYNAKQESPVKIDGLAVNPFDPAFDNPNQNSYVAVKKGDSWERMKYENGQILDQDLAVYTPKELLVMACDYVANSSAKTALLSGFGAVAVASAPISAPVLYGFFAASYGIKLLQEAGKNIDSLNRISLLGGTKNGRRSVAELGEVFGDSARGR